MKTSKKNVRFLFLTFLLFAFATPTQGQFLKKLGKAAERAAERTVERRVENETSKKTDAALDSILEPGSKRKNDHPNSRGQKDGQNGSSMDNAPQAEGVGTTGSSNPKSLSVYSKFDFVPGNNTLFYDDFSDDYIGDLPSRWNTNAGGEVVTFEDSQQKWFELKSGYKIFYIPDAKKLPSEYTIEFDIMGLGVERASSTTQLKIYISDDDKFNVGGNYVHASIPFCQYTPVGIAIENYKNNKREISSKVKADIRKAIINGAHISIAVNNERFRLWVNEAKYIDVPRLVPTEGRPHTLKFHPNNFSDGVERVFITNLKIAEGGSDLRSQLISEGKVSTNGILFDSGSDVIKPESMGIIRQISQVLQEERSINVKIVGHTDADGAEDTNLNLSKARAEAVKKALINVYAIDGSRLTTDGKGETEPIGDNATADGKAKNRRVEFIKE